MKRYFFPYSTPRYHFYKHHEDILLLQWIFYSYEGGGRIFEGLVWSQFLHYRKNNLHGLLFCLNKPLFVLRQKFYKFFYRAGQANVHHMHWKKIRSYFCPPPLFLDSSTISQTFKNRKTKIFNVLMICKILKNNSKS